MLPIQRDYRFHIYWPRGAAGGGWTTPLGSIAPAGTPRQLAAAIADLGGISTIPAVEALAGRIFTAVGGPARVIEVFLPPSRRRPRQTAPGWASASLRLAGDRVYVRLPRVDPDTSVNQAQISLALAAAVLGQADPRFDLRFTGRQMPPTTGAGLIVERTVSIPAELAAAWTRHATVRQPATRCAYLLLSREIQTALRRWLPCLYFRDASDYADAETAWPMVAYQATQPYTGRTRAELTYEVLDPRTLYRCYRSAVRRLPPVLGSIQFALEAAGRGELASLYAPRRASEIVWFAQRQRTRLHGLLSAEAAIVDDFLRLDAEMRETSRDFLQQPRGAARRVAEISMAFTRRLHCHLRQLYSQSEFRSLGSLLFLVATHALAGCPGPPAESVIVGDAAALPEAAFGR